MTSRRLSLGLAIAAIGAGVVATPAAANPPFANSSYDLLAGGALIGKAVLGPSGDKPGATLAAGSYVNADCVSGAMKLFTAHVDLAGTPISNPSGVVNAFPAATKDPPASPGTLTTRLFLRWFPSVSGTPTQAPPSGPPGGGGQGGSGPAPGDTGSGNFSGRNSPSSQTSGGFCSFNVSFAPRKVG